MNKYRISFQVSLYLDNDITTGWNQTTIVMDTLDVSGLTFFQVCVILGGLHVLVNEEKEPKA